MKGGQPSSGRSSRLVDRFAEQARRCSCDVELRRLVEQATLELGFEYFALLHHASLRGRPAANLVRMHNYPADWQSEFLDRGYIADDPVHVASTRTNSGFCWGDLGTLLPLNRRHLDILERGRRYGLGSGYTVPANVPGEPTGSCSFVARRGVALPEHRLMCAELVGLHAFRAARRLHGFPGAGHHPHLSPRELDCLRLIAAGKTDWEVSRILGLSAETAHKYVKRARAAYDVVTRTQLVVHGLRDSWISFDDAIPPYG